MRPEYIFLHWSATDRQWNPSVEECPYHVIITGIYGTVRRKHPFTEELSRHTWKRNSNSVAISIASMMKSSPYNFGPEPFTRLQLEKMCLEAARVCYKYKIPVDYEHIQTHAESAYEYHYGWGDGDPEVRWDFLCLSPVLRGTTIQEFKKMATTSANILRNKVKWYLSKIESKDPKYPLEI